MSEALGEVITFYSYKGGVGRSMAVANVGALLAQAGKNVLLIDCDFEAPGLHRYFKLEGSHGKDSARSADVSRGGMIELLHRASELLAQRLEGATDPQEIEDGVAAQLLDSRAYGHDVAIRHPDNAQASALWLIPAGRFDDAYPSRVMTFDWAGFYRRHPTFFRQLAAALSARFDYILIDSRTGITDVGSVCTVLLPEKLVLVFAPNEQSLHGALEVGRQAVEQRRDSDDLRPLPVFPLISRVENAEYEQRTQWLLAARVRFEKMFEAVYDLPRCDMKLYFDAIQIPHVSRYAYGELVAAEQEDATLANSVTAAFHRFLDFLKQDSVYQAQLALRSKDELAAHDASFDQVLSEAKQAKDEAEQRTRAIEAELNAERAARRKNRNRILAGATTLGVLGSAIGWLVPKPSVQPVDGDTYSDCVFSHLNQSPPTETAKAALRLLREPETAEPPYSPLDLPADAVTQEALRLISVPASRAVLDTCAQLLHTRAPGPIDASIRVRATDELGRALSGVEVSSDGFRSSCVTRNDGTCKVHVHDVNPSSKVVTEHRDFEDAEVPIYAAAPDFEMLTVSLARKPTAVAPDSGASAVIQRGRLQSTTLAFRNAKTPFQGGPIKPEYIVLYITRGQTLDGAIAWMQNEQENVYKTSGHAIVDRNGVVAQLVSFDRKANHAGTDATWPNATPLNAHSIGLMLVNVGPVTWRGAWFSQAGAKVSEAEVTKADATSGSQSFTQEQLASLNAIVRAIVEHYPIKRILTQAETTGKPGDGPGSAFPLQAFLAEFEPKLRQHGGDENK